MEKFSNFNNSNNFEQADKGGHGGFSNERNKRYEGATEGEDSLIPVVSEIETGLSPEQMEITNKLKNKFLEALIKDVESENNFDFPERIKRFSDKLLNKFDKETLLNLALYHVIIGSTIDKGVDRVDLDDGEIEEFINNGCRDIFEE